MVLQSGHSSPEHGYEKGQMDDYDFIDVEGDMGEAARRRDDNSPKKDVLEEGNCHYYYLIACRFFSLVISRIERSSIPQSMFI